MYRKKQKSLCTLLAALLLALSCPLAGRAEMPSAVATPETAMSLAPATPETAAPTPAEELLGTEEEEGTRYLKFSRTDFGSSVCQPDNTGWADAIIALCRSRFGAARADIIEHFIYRSDYAAMKNPSGFPVGYGNVVNDGTYQKTILASASCMKYARFVSAVMYGTGSDGSLQYADGTAGRYTTEQVKALIQGYAQPGERIEVKGNIHSMAFVAFDETDAGFYFLDALYNGDVCLEYTTYDYFTAAVNSEGGADNPLVLHNLDDSENYQTAPADGLVQDSDGIWRYYRDGVLQSGYTGLVQQTDGNWYYVAAGTLDWYYNGLTCYNGVWYYVRNGTLDWSSAGLTSYNGNWYYVQNGVLDWNYTGLCLYNGVWYYIQNGVLDWSSTGLTYYNGSWYYVQNGIVDWNYTGFCPYNGNWYYVQSGELSWSRNGLVEYNGSWYFVQNGVLDGGFTGLCPYNGALYYVGAGVLDWGYNGVAQYNGVTYLVRGGVAQMW